MTRHDASAAPAGPPAGPPAAAVGDRGAGAPAGASAAVDWPRGWAAADEAGGPGPIEARPYQLELLEAAKRENIIAYLETGGGKTLVSALLIKDALASAGGEKFALFVVDRVPLVVQQAKYVQSALGDHASVAVFFGHMGVESWGEERWTEATDGKNVLFMTAQVLLTALRHDVVHFERICLLIFDEAHHATKSHPFNSIMREFYFPSEEDGLPLPRVFGMSASPVKVKGATRSAEYCEDAIMTLQRNLQARVVVVSAASQSNVDACIPKPEEFVVKYAVDRPAVLVTSAARKRAEGGGDTGGGDRLEGPPEQTGLAAGAEDVGDELGSFARGYLTGAGGSGQAPHPAAPPLGSIAPKALALLDLLVYECRRWAGLPDVGSAFRCIVFVQRRDVAVGLAWLINEVLAACDTPRLRARAALGTRTSSSSVPACMRTSQAQQTAALRDFRAGAFGILVATNVVEEGLDVASCGLVVMFNSILSPKAYIQSRGRARHVAARYVVLVPEGGPGAGAAQENLRVVRDGAEAMHLVVRDLTKGPAPPAPALGATGTPAAQAADEQCLRSATTRARVSPTAAVDLLNVYCASLPKDKYFIAEGPVGPSYAVTGEGGLFLCDVTLPISSPVKRGRCTDPQASHTQARRLAALDAYRLLYECGALDEHLFAKDYATRYRDLGALRKGTTLVDAAGVAAAGEALSKARSLRIAKRALRRERVCTVQQPRELRWPRPKVEARLPVSVFLYEISVDESLLAANKGGYMSSIPSSRRCGIVTRHGLSESDLVAFKAPSGDRLLTLTPLPCLELSPEQDSLASRYGLALHQVATDDPHAVLRRKAPVCGTSSSSEGDGDGDGEGAGECGEGGPGVDRADEVGLEMPGFHLVPLAADGGPDWGAMQRLIAFDPTSWPPPGAVDGTDAIDAVEYSLVQSRHDTRYRVYFSETLSPALTPKSACGAWIGGGQYATFEAYYRDRHNRQVVHDDAPMLAGYAKNVMGEELRNVFYLLPELCRVVPASPWALYYLSLMPFWQTFLAMQAFRRQLAVDDSIPFGSLACALQPRRSSPHCEGVNYERLEFFGDAILKVLASMAVFQQHPYDHEGVLTNMRDAVVCNSFLCDRSVSQEVYNVVALTGSAVRAKSWPFPLGCPQEVTLSMSEKLLADCVESMIGLYYVHGGLAMSARLLEELDLVAGMANLIGNRFVQPPRKNGGGGDDPRATAPRLAEVEKIIGYTFARKDVLVEALTHSSYKSSEVLSYQRLEFLGDAVMGHVVLKGFYERYEDLDPAQLTLIREPALSNELFGRVVVDFGLHKYLWHDSALLERDVRATVAAFEAETDDEDVCDTMAVPKVLGDILEAIVGAVVVDQDMTLDAVEPIVDRLMSKALQRFANPETLAQHPVTKMSQALQAQYGAGPEFVYASVAAPGPAGADAILCTIRVAGVDIAAARGMSRRKAKRSAAQVALERMGPPGGASGERVAE